MKTLLSVAALMATLMVSACATDHTVSPPAAGKSAGRPSDLLIPAAKLNALQKGMTAEQVVALLGKPAQVRRLRDPELKGEIWSYRIAYTAHTEQEATSMREVPGWDPISNVPMTLHEPVYSIRQVRNYQTVELLMIHGLLVERKAGQAVESSYE